MSFFTSTDHQTITYQEAEKFIVDSFFQNTMAAQNGLNTFSMIIIIIDYCSTWCYLK